MDTASLDLFADVMRAGGFAAAARERGVAPSTVSRAIAALERDLGVRLFERSTRRFQPTEAALRYADDLEPLLAGLEDAAARARDVARDPSGTVRIAASVAFGHSVLLPLVPGIRERWPGLHLDLVLDDRPLDLLDAGVHLAVRLGPPPGGDWIRTRLMRVRHRVCASPAYLDRHGEIREPAELSARDCVRFPFDGFDQRWLVRARGGDVASIGVGGSLTVSSALALRAAVLAGLGPGLLADWMIGAELERGELVDLLPRYEVTATTFENAAWLLYPNRQYLPHKLRVVIDALRAGVAAT